MRLPVSAKPPEFGTARRWQEVATVRVRLATPMLGGGSETKVPDLDQPFRPSAIRGALRRWWRATESFASEDEVKERERELWGMANETTAASRVRVEVDAEPISESRRCRLAGNPAKAHLEDEQSNVVMAVPPYAVGLFAGDLKNLRAVPPGATFSLRIESDAAAKERLSIGIALAAWLTYGGIGMRTRRGFGALEVLEMTAGKTDGRPLLTGMLQRGRVGTAGIVKSGFTSLKGARVLLRGETSSAEAAWLASVRALGEFSKGLMPGATRPYHGDDSHSPWPEADAIRQAEKGDLFHGWEPGEPIPTPRAELGLPRNFKSAPNASPAWRFRGEQLPNVDTEHRLASPVIAKPIQTGRGWQAGIVLLSRGRMDLNTDAYGWPAEFWDGRGDAGRAVPSANLRLNPKTIHDDVVDVLADYLAKTGWTNG